VKVGAVNDPPVAVDDAASTLGAPVDVPVVANDSDVDGDTLSVSEHTEPARGLASCGASTCKYTPPAGTNFGFDSFTYTVSDGNGGTDTGRVTITQTRPTFTLSEPSAPPGGELIASGAGCPESSIVQIAVEDLPAGQSLSDGRGEFSFPINVPANLSIGRHAVEVTCGATQLTRSLDALVSTAANNVGPTPVVAALFGFFILLGGVLLGPRANRAGNSKRARYLNGSFAGPYVRQHARSRVARSWALPATHRAARRRRRRPR
jgi:hypothetical protein